MGNGELGMGNWELGIGNGEYDVTNFDKIRDRFLSQIFTYFATNSGNKYFLFLLQIENLFCRKYSLNLRQII